MRWNVIYAILNRNLISYFSTPTGYVFICLFVLLSSFAAFWPNEFFSSNLANLDQLNGWIPSILLVFIPAITMSIWSEERRQGTDELLLTIPAGDIDVVLGKFFAATGIYSIALFFSMLCNLTMLYFLASGQMDFGLFVCTYFGYWLMGLAMIAIGMIASFISANLTVSFILGALLNAPLVLAQWAEGGFINNWTARFLNNWSFGGQFRDFGRGVFSLPGMIYFLGIASVGLYMCLVLIGRRHWMGGRDGQSLWLHYICRFVGMILIVVGLNSLIAGPALGRIDVSGQRLNSLSASTIEVLKNLDKNKPVQIEAYVSAKLPDSYQQQRLALENFLREIEKASGSQVTYRIINVEPLSKEARLAEQQYGIKSRSIEDTERGVYKSQDTFMGLAFISGLEKLVLEFVEKDVPLEYELTHSIWAVTQTKRKKVGILNNDAEVLGGGFDMQMMSQRQSSYSQLVKELKKQYEVSGVDPNSPIELKDEKGNTRYDTLIVIQPSSLNPTQLDNLIEALRAGQHAVLFEDPFPFPEFTTAYPGTNIPKRPKGGMFGGGQPPEPKGNIKKLWDLLGVELQKAGSDWTAKKMQQSQGTFGNPRAMSPEAMDPTYLIWGEYTSLKQIDSDQLPREFVFISQQDTAKGPDIFNPDFAATKNLDTVLFPCVGSLVKTGTTNLTPLVKASKRGGTIAAGDFVQTMQSRDPKGRRNLELESQNEHVLAYLIKGSSKKSTSKNLPYADEDSPEKAKADAAKSAAKQDNPKDTAATDPVPPAPVTPDPKAEELNVILVADADVCNDIFFLMRNSQNDTFKIYQDNVPFVLNIIDESAGQALFQEIRSRTFKPNTLKSIDEWTEKYRTDDSEAMKQYSTDIKQQIQKIQDEVSAKIADLEKRKAALDPDKEFAEIDVLNRRIEMVKQNDIATAQTTIKRLNDDTVLKAQILQGEYNAKVSSIQDRFKLAALLIPPIPPLIVAFVVFFTRRAREKEGVNRSRLR